MGGGGILGFRRRPRGKDVAFFGGGGEGYLRVEGAAKNVLKFRNRGKVPDSQRQRQRQSQSQSQNQSQSQSQSQRQRQSQR